MGKWYIIQQRWQAWDRWEKCPESLKYGTLAEAREALTKMPRLPEKRIAEAYTVTRYKAVKL